MSAISTADELKNQALRDGIAEMTACCTDKQLALIHRIHDNAPWKGLDNCPPELLTETYELLRRTSIANEGDKP